MKYRNKLGVSILILCLAQGAYASSIDLCVFDVMGANGDVMALSRDYALAAKQWGVDIQPKVYTSVSQAVKDFENKKCNGLFADNYSTKKYNNFVGTVGAVGAIPNYDVAQKVLTAIASPRLASKLKNKNHEVVGFMPFGLAYFFTKDRNLNSLEKLNGLRVGILDEDPSQRRMAQRVGMKPIIMTIDNLPTKFRNGDMDLAPAPLLAYEPYELGKIIGNDGGVVNYPLAFMSMNLVMSMEGLPDGFGLKSRQWFAQKLPQMMRTVERWDATLPKKVMYEIPAIDRSGYDTLLSQMRKEFVDNKTYDASMITLIRHLRCAQEPTFLECQKK